LWLRRQNKLSLSLSLSLLTWSPGFFAVSSTSVYTRIQDNLVVVWCAAQRPPRRADCRSTHQLMTAVSWLSLVLCMGIGSTSLRQCGTRIACRTRTPLPQDLFTVIGQRPDPSTIQDVDLHPRCHLAIRDRTLVIQDAHSTI